MKLYKKILSIMLSVLLCFPCVTYKKTVTVRADLNDIENTLNEVQAILQHMTLDPGVASKIYGAFKEVSGTINGIFGLYNTVTTILKAVGIMEDPTATALKNILDIVGDTKDLVLETDKHINEMATAMEASFAEVQLSFDKIAFETERDRWYAFYNNNIKKLDGYLDATGSYKNYTDSKVREYYLDTLGNEDIHLYYVSNDSEIVQANHDQTSSDPNKDDFGKTIVSDYNLVISKENISQAKTNTALSQTTVDEAYEKLKSTLTAAFKLGFDETSMPSVWVSKLKSEYGDDLSESIDEIADGFAEDAINAIVCGINRKYASTINSNSETNAHALFEAFKNYCGDIVGNGGISALKSRYSMIYLTNIFEKDGKEAINEISDYLTLLTAYYANSVLMLMKQSGASSTEISTAQDLWVSTTEFIKDQRSKAITGNDNYCYPLNCVISSMDVYVTSSMTTRNDRHIDVDNYNGLDKPLKDYYLDFSQENWKLVDGNGEAITAVMADNTDMLSIYYRYRATSNAKNLKTYLNDYLPEGSKIKNDTLLTKWNGTQKFVLSEDTSLKEIVFCGEYFNEKYKSYFSEAKNVNLANYTKCSKIESDYFVIHDKAVGDTFDITNTGGLNHINTNLAYRAMYGETHTFWYYDENAMFYTNSDNLTTNYKTNIMDISTLEDESGSVFWCNKWYQYKRKLNLSYAYSIIVKSSPKSEELTQTVKEEEDTSAKTFKTVLPSNIDDSWIVNEENGTLSSQFTSTGTLTAEQEYMDSINNPATLSAEQINALREEQVIYNLDGILDNLGVDNYQDFSEDQKKNLIYDEAVQQNMTEDIKKLLADIDEKTSSYDNAMGKNTELDLMKTDSFTYEKEASDISDEDYAKISEAMNSNGELIYVYKILNKVNEGLSFKVVYDVSLYMLDNDVMTKVSDDLLKSKHISPRITLPANFKDNAKNNMAEVKHYEDLTFDNLLDDITTPIRGTGDGRYVQFTVKTLSPFEMKFYTVRQEYTPPNTGVE